MKALETYGPIKAGRVYKIMDAGFDWLLVSVNGKPMYAFLWVFYRELDI